MRVLITGGAGFIGSHVAEGLLARGYTVRIFDNFFTGKEENIAHIKDKVEFIRGDLSDPLALDMAAGNCYAIVHLAALRSVSVSMQYPHDYYRVNVSGTHNVLEAARRNNVKRVIFASSSSVYGNAKEMPLKEGTEGVRLSPYAISKKSCEDCLAMFAQHYDVDTLSLRFFNVFGPRQDPHSQYSAVIPLFITKLLNNEQPTIFGDGTQSRDFTHIANIVHGIDLAIKSKKRFNGDAVNLANGAPTTVNELFKKIRARLGKEHIEPVYAPPRKGDILHSHADAAKAKEIRGFEPVMDFDSGLNETVDWFAARHKAL